MNTSDFYEFKKRKKERRKERVRGREERREAGRLGCFGLLVISSSFP